MVFTLPAARVVDDVRVAVRMPWGGVRNIALRTALEPIAPDLTVGFIDQQGSITTRSATQRSAQTVERVLRQVVGADGLTGVFAREDGEWVAYAQFSPAGG